MTARPLPRHAKNLIHSHPGLTAGFPDASAEYTRPCPRNIPGCPCDPHLRASGICTVTDPEDPPPTADQVRNLDAPHAPEWAETKEYQ